MLQTRKTDAPVAIEEALPEPQAVEAAPGQISTEAGAARAQAWLEGLDTLRARFDQIAADNSETSGVLEIDRPGRARFDYDDPNPILVVADGSTVAIADFDLETIDRAHRCDAFAVSARREPRSCWLRRCSGRGPL
ncbi:MAG: outer membrane lipoprotein carrier protein LolA [Oceanicaulis sp.]|nr:outer membrane lipoprotein carrier protein LolA [Oceanicaulis sp.]